ncbi:hypothetical protein N7447_005466 [Penicillium robsamsonii]|uniref:uncharacterized protein n=1 Tax=Penicillium robsamsonii TaxID=1792511 RepID=UPI00254753AF|nr:uncharacterized protein N7447_005466 [Penicillium robsamsonii]KAJ5823126.1 hypothetical protein N7447_005466 [Penicillium robsamsonii]
MELPPGRWAEYAISLPWDAARRGTHIRTDILTILRGHELQRELVVRTTISWNARRFDMETGQNSTRAEAVLIFMTGNLMDVPCTYCQEGRGIFPYAFEAGNVAPQERALTAGGQLLLADAH